jgi:hypothetical protein
MAKLNYLQYSGNKSGNHRIQVLSGQLYEGQVFPLGPSVCIDTVIADFGPRASLSRLLSYTYDVVDTHNQSNS